MTFARENSGQHAAGPSVSVMTYRRTIGAGAIMCALLIAGCATAEIPTAEPEPAPESTPVAPEPTEEPAPEDGIPAPLLELGCEEAVPIDRVIELYGTEMVALDTQLTGISSALLLTSAALADGALWCSWTPPGEEFATMTLTASVATTDEYAVGYDGYDL